MRFWPLLLLATLVAGCGGSVYAERKIFADDILGLARTMAQKMEAEQ